MSFKRVRLISLAIVWLAFMGTVENAAINSTVYDVDMSPPINTINECVNKTGWASHHIDSALEFNDGCSVVCVVKGQDYAHTIRENEPCFDHQHICHHGSCYLKTKVPATSDEVYAHIKIHSANVRDADPWPMQGSSDAFAVVELVDPKSTSSIICHTKTIQDSNQPKWNHQCTSNPMKMTSTLRFSVYDSDKPVERPDKLGSAAVKLEDIADGEPHDLDLSGSPGAGTQGPFIKISVNVQKISV
ncbi:hypothetical protein GZH46_02525 [Fragariocoptes setiger]|uniref:C2 domain-containing protein n=1 Tax=Fragariocoptes setiger TaxID=1670756 RepID=A0ABQ7S6B7_9ACAR|nr:hypothetical protein GZH46_02525 [Fragariocoptes setiger]